MGFFIPISVKQISNLQTGSSDNTGLESEIQVDEFTTEQKEMMTEKAIGSNTAHNNIQLFLIIGAWCKTA